MDVIYAFHSYIFDAEYRGVFSYFNGVMKEDAGLRSSSFILISIMIIINVS